MPASRRRPSLLLERLEDRTLLTVQPLAPVHPTFTSLSPDGTSGLSSVSPDGQFVAFQSDANDLVPNDNNGQPDVFLYAVATGQTRLLSVDPNGYSNRFPSTNPKFSPDGRYVLYDRGGDLFISPAQVLAYDLQTDTTVLVSANTSGGYGDAGSENGSWSADSTKVVFESKASNLVAGDTNGHYDIFVRDLTANTTIRASVAQDGTQALPGAAFFSKLCYNAQFSGNGRFVVFDSTANNLGPTDANTVVDVYVKDLQTGAVDMVTVETNGVAQALDNAIRTTQAISDDGRYVVFTANFAAFGGSNVVVRDRVARTTSMVSVNAAGTTGRGGASGVITPNGRYVAFVSGGGDLDSTITDSNGSEDIFVRDLTTNATRLVSLNTAGTNGGNGRSGFGLYPNIFTFVEPVISPDGRYVAFHSDASNLVAGDANGTRDVFVRDRQTNTTTRISQGGNKASYGTALSADFTVAAFESESDNLAPGDRNYFFRDVYVRNLTAGTTQLVSQRSPFLPEPRLYSQGSRVVGTSSDGRYVAFISRAPFIRPVSDLVPGINATDESLYVRDTVTGQLTVENVTPAGTATQGRVFSGAISADGRYSAFDGAGDLDASVPNTQGRTQAWFRDRQTGRTRMVSLTPAGAASGGIQPNSVVLSPDGRYVSFQSTSPDLVTGFTDGNASGDPDTYIYDTLTSITRLVSHVPGSATTSGSGDSYGAVFTADGRRLAFLSRSTNLVAGVTDANNYFDVFVYDTASGAVELVTVNTAGTGTGNQGWTTGALQFSADGRYLTFYSPASDLTANANDGGEDVFRRDLVAGTTALVSVDLAGTGSGTGGAAGFSMTPDGRYIAFSTTANNIVAGDTNGRGDVFLRDMTTSVTTRIVPTDPTANSYAPVISADGRYVSFISGSAALVPDFVDGNGFFGDDLYLLDRTTGGIVLVTASTSGTGSGDLGFSDGPRLFSPDGKTLYFTGRPSNLYPGDRNGADDAFAFTMNGAGRIKGTVFADADRDGTRDGGEAAIPFWTVYLDTNDNGRFDVGEPNVQADLSGNYAFTALAAGTYKVGLILADGYTRTTAAVRTVTLATATTTVSGQDFGAATAETDLEVSQVTATAETFTGGAITVTWLVRNLGASAATGAWQDAVYLSADQTLDAADRLLGVVAHSGGLAASASYTGSLTTTLPTLPPGTYYVFVRADRRQQVSTDVTRENNLATAFDPIDLSIPALTLGTPLAASFTGPNQDRYFTLTVAAGQSVVIRLDSAATSGGTELYARFAGTPTPFDFDHAARVAGQPDQTLTIPLTRPGTYTILAHSRSGAAATSAFTLTATAAAFDVTGVSPFQGANSGRVTVAIRGTALTSATVPTLVRGTTTVAAASVDFRDPTLLYATFDLAGKAVGTYDVRLTSGAQSDTLAGGFAVVAPVPTAGALSVNLSVPALARAGRKGKVLVEYANLSGSDIPAPLLRLTVNDAVLRLPGQPEFGDAALNFLGVAPDGPGGVLRPGQRGSVEVEFQSTGPVGTPISVGLFTNDRTESINWASVKAAARPASMPADAWDVVFANLTASAGTTREYEALLGRNASHLSTLGIYTADISRLLSVELADADAARATASLVTVTETTLAAPGFALAFVRRQMQAIHGRYTVGPFGRGWSHNWDGEATADPDGDVVVRMGDVRRSFFRKADGSYGSARGEYATLTLTGGIYSLRETDGTVLRFRADGKFDWVEDVKGNRVTAAYTAGRLTSVTHTGGASITLTYNAQGRIDRLTDSAGRTVSYAYDVAGQHLTGYADQYGSHTYTYVTGQGAAREHALASINYADDTHTLFTYDARGRLLTRERDGGQERVTFGYSTGGLTLTEAVGATTTLRFDDGGRIARRIDPLGRAADMDYCTCGSLMGVELAGGADFRYGYDDHGNLTTMTDAVGQVSTYRYDARDNLVSFTDALDRTTHYAYDAESNLVRTVFADGNDLAYSYDAAGNVLSATNRRDRTTAYQYNAAGQVTRKTLPDGQVTDYTYDARGRMTTATDAGGTVTLEYTSHDQLRKVTYADGKFLQFTHDVLGRRTRSVDQDGFTVNYAYDDLGRLDRLTTGAGGLIVDYAYDAAGRLVREDNGNGTATTQTFDAAGQLVRVTHLDPGGATNARLEYAYDGLGRRSSMTLTDADAATADGTTTYGYDALGQLTTVVLPGGRTIEYQYDAGGNRTAVRDNGATTAYASNLVNGYVQVGATAYAYDADGNLTAQTGPGGGTAYTYDDEGRLTGVTGPGQTATYAYDALGHRRSATVNGQTTSLLVDPVGAWAVTAEYDGGGTALARYTWGLGLTSRVDAGGSAAYYDFDASGNTVGLTNAAGAYVNRYSYLPFGETTTHAAAVGNGFTFGGALGVRADGGDRFDMRFRSYTAGLGQFASPDPLGLGGGDANTRRYVGNSPVSFADPLGLWYIALQGGFGIPGLSGSVGLQAGTTACGDFGLFPSFGGGPSVGGLGASAAIYGSMADVVLGPSTTATATVLLPSITGPYSGDPLAPITPGHPDNAVGLGLGLGCSITPTQTYTFPQLIHNVLNALIGIIGSGDPNDITGPAGFGPDHAVAVDSVMPYTIRFENMPVATAPAQEVLVTHTLDADVDLATFQLGDFGFGDLVIDVPAGVQSYETRIAYTNLMSGNSPLFVDVRASLDAETGIVSWILRAIDPVTGELPDGVLDGFLPPNDETHRGEGFVRYSVRPKAASPADTVITAQASIVFDTNAAILTNVYSNVIDRTAPTATVAAPFASMSRAFPVSWAGADPSGIASYDVYVSVNGGAFTLWQNGVTTTSAVYTGAPNSRYTFYALATDNVGNRQATPSSQTTTYVVNAAAALRRSGANVQLLDVVRNVVVGSRPISDPSPLWVLGSNTTADTLSVNYAFGGEFALTGGIRFDAGSGTGDRFFFVGKSNLSATVTTGATQTVTSAGTTMTLTGVDSQQMTSLASLTINTTGGNDVFTLSRPATGQQRISGTGLAALTFFAVPTFALDVGVGDTAVSANVVTVSGGWGATGLKNVTVNGGVGGDSLRHYTTKLSLPVGGGVQRFDAGTGTDNVLVSGNASWVLSNAGVASTAGGRVTLSGVEVGTLAGGAGNNLLDAAQFSGTAYLTGSTGNDTIKGGTGVNWLRETGNVNFTLTNTRLTGLGTDTLSRITQAALTGGIGNNTLNAAAFTGEVRLDGGAGNDKLLGSRGGSVLLGNAGNDALTGNVGRDVLIGGTGIDTLTGGGDDDLLIAGTTAYDANATALMTLLAEWKRTDRTYAERVASMRTGGTPLTGTTVPADTSRDTLRGNAGADWFWLSLTGSVLDSLLDLEAGEERN